MANYVGRLNQQLEYQSFLGINSKSSIVAGVAGEAVDIDNWDIDLSGAITRRQGYATQYTFGANTNHFDSFFKLDGTQVYIAVSGGNLWEATSPSGIWTNRGGTFSTGDFTYIGADLNGQYVLCNGVDAPSVFIPGASAKTLEIASLLSVPTNLSVASTVNAGIAYQYAVSALTPRGETTLSAIASTVTGPSSLTVSSYNTISWTPPAGAFALHVWRYDPSDNSFHIIATLQGTSTSYVDNGSAVEDIYSYPPASNTAYNTPNDWNLMGQPEGVFVMARGKDQRMVAWRGSFIWASALSNIYDWYTANDSFSFQVLGGDNNNIKAVATLFDYTLFFSPTNCFVYTGSNYNDISLSKILSTGCSSHYAKTHVGDDLYIWSQFGPTQVSRILYGADIQTNPIGAKISPITFGGSNYSAWSKIRAWHDLSAQRICFSLPLGSNSNPNSVLAYNYQTKGWTKFSLWNINNVVWDPVDKINYGTFSNQLIVAKLHNGNLDGPSPITNSYTGIYEDFRTYLKKRSVFLDVLMDPSSPYAVTVTLNLDYQSPAVVPQTYTLTYDGVTAFTDNEAITLQGNLVNTHRIVVFGDARAMQLVFNDVGGFLSLGFMISQPARIFGWRIDLRARGIR